MQIHVVQQGDSVYQLANTYESSVADIIEANDLTSPDALAIGQALVIPIVGQFYFVQPGDTLTSIANQFGFTVQEIARINGLSINQTLSSGMRIYIPPIEKRPITSYAYVEPFGDTVSSTLETAAENRSPYLTYLALFSYQVNRDGTLKAPPAGNLFQTANANNTAMAMVITNLEEGAFSDELGHIIVTVSAVQNTLLTEIINTALQQGFRDVHFDLEFLPGDDREAYNQFLRTAKERLSQEGLLVSTALAPKTSGTQTGQWYEAHDYAAHGEIVDFVVLMTYEWGYSYGPPMAVSPLNSVRDVIEYAVSVIPPEKILMGQNLYGYDWTLPFVEGGGPAQAVSPQQAIQIAIENNAAIQFDPVAQAPFFTYTDSAGANHEVWFEDARSIQGKFDLIREFNLLGIAYWKLGLAFPQNWLLLNDQFTITKLE
ncbi:MULTISPECIES: glycoside hydrolase family 18 protein [Oceanobacillus]|uniref:Spore germination protein YaaH n=1 Tax=Oceanobacillus kimchii TaxID=746691 RepID=A0ABQ5TCG4_9BACI|nr:MULTISPECIES: glycoside hydrolase family 18 protein [Oceanobacillus]MBT2599875.1 glycoside hydrolase family 18 protein [Oceanobacillus sp. ISL-74]MBT2652675.1 glycoside hydrolase family 18 protein [Oceanobacillus sp. ISL-73]MCT1577218.1 glycoside hydrolase family 18 protein [Oceanobacillus kimchii]MCT2135288.1 glycoside hydrolase family 18 protein [Oceanobacillus kimchii]OEH56554.1 spore gernimation protein [Oceanobacillus sp. E9]